MHFKHPIFQLKQSAHRTRTRYISTYYLFPLGQPQQLSFILPNQHKTKIIITIARIYLYLLLMSPLTASAIIKIYATKK